MQSDNNNFNKLLGYKIVESDNGSCVVELEVRDELKQGFGLLHGGAIATLADYTMGRAICSMINRIPPFVTAQMNINYISSVKEGKVTGYGCVKRLGKRLSFCECEIKNNLGEIIATATGIYYML